MREAAELEVWEEERAEGFVPVLWASPANGKDLVVETLPEGRWRWSEAIHRAPPFVLRGARRGVTVRGVERSAWAG